MVQGLPELPEVSLVTFVNISTTFVNISPFFHRLNFVEIIVKLGRGTGNHSASIAFSITRVHVVQPMPSGSGLDPLSHRVCIILTVCPSL